MADHLQRFSDLFTDLEDTVVALDKKKADLTGAITTLEAKEGFLKQSVKELSDQVQKATDTQAQAVQKRHIELKELDQVIQGVKKEIKRLREVQVTTETAFQDVQKSHEREIAEHEEQLSNKRGILKDIDITITEHEAVVTGLQTDVKTLKNQIEQLNVDLGNRESEVKAEIDQFIAKKNKAHKDYQLIVNSLDDKQSELEELLGKIDAAKTTLTEIDKKQADFEISKQTAIKALESREEALIEAENRFELSRRRPGIVDKIQ